MPQLLQSGTAITKLRITTDFKKKIFYKKTLKYNVQIAERVNP